MLDLEERFNRVAKILDGLVEFMFNNVSAYTSLDNESALSYLASVRHELSGYIKKK